MGIFYTHTEDEKYHIYKQKPGSRKLALSLVAVFLVGSLIAYYFHEIQPNTTISDVGALFAILAFAIYYFNESFIIHFRKEGAIGQGKEIIQKGSFLNWNQPYFEIKIEKLSNGWSKKIN